jgi:hypothetical protein
MLPLWKLAPCMTAEDWCWVYRHCDPSLFTAAALNPFGETAALTPDVEEALSLLQRCVWVSSGTQGVSIDGLSL